MANAALRSSASSMAPTITTFSIAASRTTGGPNSQFGPAQVHPDLKLRAECPVPCGWNDWLCCAANEICYTAPNSEAACSPTALPSIQISIVIYTSTLKNTKTMTKTVSLTDTAKHTDKTSLVTETSVETSTVTYTSPLSRPTTTTTVVQNGNSTENPVTPVETQSGLSLAQKAGIGVGAGIVLLVAIAALVWCFCLKKQRSGGGKYSESTDGDSGADAHNRNYARFQHRIPSRSRSAEEPAHNLGPRESFMQSGDNPYNNYELDVIAPAPPYNSVPSPHPAQYGQSMGRGQQRQSRSSAQANGVPPRVPVPRGPPRVDDYRGY